MAIGVKLVKGKNSPVVYCDVCGKQIHKGSEGGVNYPLLKEEQVDGIRFFHRNGSCSTKWKDHDWTGLDFFLVNLLHNCGITQSEIEEDQMYQELFS